MTAFWSATTRWVQGIKPNALTDYSAGFGDVPSLDGMRALSIAAVMLSHLAIPQVPGGHGVFLFFIISGFLITRLVYAEQKQTGRLNVFQFYIRRFFRLYPAIIVFCLIVSTSYYIVDGRLALIEPASVLFYFSNYLVASRDLSGVAYQIEPMKIFWSLSVEEHFYLVFPLVALNLKRPAFILVAAIAICLFALLLRIYYSHFYPELVGGHYLYMRTEFRMDAVAFGVALASVCELNNAKRWLDVLVRPIVFVAALAIGAISIFISDDYFANVWRYVVLGPAICVVMLGLIFSPRYSLIQIFLNNKTASFIGRLSYSLYIWHLPAQVVALSVFGGLTGVAASLALSFVVATISFYVVERPMIAMRRRFGSHSPR